MESAAPQKPASIKYSPQTSQQTCLLTSQLPYLVLAAATVCFEHEIGNQGLKFSFVLYHHIHRRFFMGNSNSLILDVVYRISPITTAT